MRNGGSDDTRYNKDELLGVFQHQRESGQLDRNLEELFQGNWSLSGGRYETTVSTARGDPKEQTPGPEVCWLYGSEAEPLGLAPMTESEKQVLHTQLVRYAG